jgi:ribosomal-protein-alanine N-acetyltransferase
MRKVTPADLPRLLVIEFLTQKAPWSEEIFLRCLNHGGYDCWGVDADNLLVGFIMLSSSSEGESHILNLCIDPAYQHQGYGRGLLEHALTHAREKGMGISYLEVRKSNRRAITLYEKTGFIQIGERKGYYPGEKNREDALVFAMDLVFPRFT